MYVYLYVYIYLYLCVCLYINYMCVCIYIYITFYDFFHPYYSVNNRIFLIKSVSFFPFLHLYLLPYITLHKYNNFYCIIVI